MELTAKLGPEVKELLKKCNNNAEYLTEARDTLISLQKQNSDLDSTNTSNLNSISLDLNESTLKFNSNIDTFRSKIPSLDSRIQKLESETNVDSLSDSDLATLKNNTATEVQKINTELANDILSNNTKVKNELYNAIVGSGSDGGFLQVKYNSESDRNEVQTSELVNFNRIATTPLQVDSLKSEPPNTSAVFDKWYRFAHGRSYQRTSDQNSSRNITFHNSIRAGWKYESSISGIQNDSYITAYTGFITDQKLDNWFIKTRIHGLSNANYGLFSVILGFMTDSNGREHTISAVRTNYINQSASGVDFRYVWSIVYDYMQDLEFELVSNSYIKSQNAPWKDNYAIREARRNKTNLKCYTSVASDSINVEPLSDSVLEYTLPLTKPSNYSDAMYNNLKTMLSSPSQMGIGLFGTYGTFIILEQKYIFDDEKIYDFASNNIWEYVENKNSWRSVGNCNSLLDGLQYSKTTKTLYYLYNIKAYNLNSAIQQLQEDLQIKDSDILEEAKEYTDSKSTQYKQDLESTKERVSKLEVSFNDLNTKF